MLPGRLMSFADVLFDPVGLQQAVAAVLAAVDDADDVVGVAVNKEVVIQQVHLQNRLIRAHGLDGDALGAHDLELGLLADIELGGDAGDQGLLAQALGKTGLVLADLAVNGGAGRVDSARISPSRDSSWARKRVLPLRMVISTTQRCPFSTEKVTSALASSRK